MNKLLSLYHPAHYVRPGRQIIHMDGTRGQVASPLFYIYSDLGERPALRIRFEDIEMPWDVSWIDWQASGFDEPVELGL